MTSDALGSRTAAWVEDAVGAEVVSARPLSGGYSSSMLGLTHADGRATVLRRMVREPWRRHAEGLLRREADVQGLLAGSPVLVPEPLAVDPRGEETGVPSLLMTRLPGEIDLVRADDELLRALAEVLVAIHRVRPEPGRWPRDYQSWAVEEKWRVPAWSADDSVYEQAFAMLAAGPPGYRPTFLHRDFHPGNVLWSAGRVSGVVDWVETSTGPAALDVAHCATNLATLHGVEAAERFRGLYRAAGGLLDDTWEYWQVLDLVGFLPARGRESGAEEATVTRTWRAHGRPDLTPDLARRRREELLRLTLRG